MDTINKREVINKLKKHLGKSMIATLRRRSGLTRVSVSTWINNPERNSPHLLKVGLEVLLEEEEAEKARQAVRDRFKASA